MPYKGASPAIIDLAAGRINLVSAALAAQISFVRDGKIKGIADVRDESAEDVRVIVQPRSRDVDATVMMESLFRLSEFETRFPMNMNVLFDGVVPRVVSLADALRQFAEANRSKLATKA